MAYYFFLLDAKTMNFYAMKSVPKLYDVFSVLNQIYSNIRTFIRYNPFVRVALKLETKARGIYLTDVMLSTIKKMFSYCEMHGFTEKRIEIIAMEMRRLELLIRDILQYSQYFIKADYKQKPDIEVATEKYKEMVDRRTVEELREITGEKALIDFNELLYKRDDFHPNQVEDDEYEELEYQEQQIQEKQQESNNQQPIQKNREDNDFENYVQEYEDYEIEF